MEKVLSWFEIPVINFERAQKFYESIFGFEMPIQNIQGYLMGFFPDIKNGSTGAIVKGDGYAPSMQGAVIYLYAGDDLNQVLSKIENARGKVLLPKTIITEEYGYFAFFADTEGNKIGLHSMK